MSILMQPYIIWFL